VASGCRRAGEGAVRQAPRQANLGCERRPPSLRMADRKSKWPQATSSSQPAGTGSNYVVRERQPQFFRSHRRPVAASGNSGATSSSHHSVHGGSRPSVTLRRRNPAARSARLPCGGLEALLGVPGSIRESRESNSDTPVGLRKPRREDLGIEVLSTDWRQLGPTCAHLASSGAFSPSPRRTDWPCTEVAALPQ
jgi:hypothetical protein